MDPKELFVEVRSFETIDGDGVDLAVSFDLEVFGPFL